MASKRNQSVKKRLHPRNKNRERYELDALISTTPELAEYVKPNKYGVNSVDFAHPMAVKLLNQALLKHDYGISYWDFPEGKLCPPIPGRADYLHHIADLLSAHNAGVIPEGKGLTGLDIGMGASCIYPILGVSEYGWKFIGSDIDAESIESAKKIVDENTSLQDMVECRLQEEPKHIFRGILGEEETVDFSICNPPFHATLEEAQAGSRRKVRNLSGKNEATPSLNFGGTSHELIYEGGEHQFIHTMIKESKEFSHQCNWFSTLVSQKAHLAGMYKSLAKKEATQVKTMPMGTGNKSSRIVAWTYLSPQEQHNWADKRWQKR